MKEYVAGSKKQEEGVLGYYETDSVVYHEDGVTPKYIFHVIRPLLTDEEKETYSDGSFCVNPSFSITTTTF